MAEVIAEIGQAVIGRSLTVGETTVTVAHPVQSPDLQLLGAWFGPCRGPSIELGSPVQVTDGRHRLFQAWQHTANPLPVRLEWLDKSAELWFDTEEEWSPGFLMSWQGSRREES